MKCSALTDLAVFKFVSPSNTTPWHYTDALSIKTTSPVMLDGVADIPDNFSQPSVRGSSKKQTVT